MKKRKRKFELNITEVDITNIELLRRFLSGEGKSARIVSRYVTGITAVQQRRVAKAIKRARQLNLL